MTKKMTALIAVRVTEDIPRMVEQAAERRYTNMAGYVRQAVCEKLERDGFLPSPPARQVRRPRSADVDQEDAQYRALLRSMAPYQVR